MSDMYSNSNYSQFIEHSFRRLAQLIHEQDNSINPTSISPKKESGRSSSLTINNPEFESIGLKSQSNELSMNSSKPIDSFQTKVKGKSKSVSHRTYMRPPKSRTTISYRCSSSQLSDQSEISLNRPSISRCSPVIIEPESNEFPVHMPFEQSLYDMKFERDRQNDVREKYNIPPPFQRKWLRQPRYVPQERPNIGQIKHSQNP